MTKLFIDHVKHAACRASPNRGLMLVEIQRWEDDGGAILADRPSRPQHWERHLHGAPHELAAAE